MAVLFCFMHASDFLLLALLSFSLSFILTPLTIPLCKRVGALDYPDGKRKINTYPTPRLGGLAFFAAFFALAFRFAALDRYTAAALSSGALLVAGGFADDVFDLPPKTKLFIQGAAALTAVIIIGPPESFSFFGLFKISLFGALGVLIAVFKMLFTVNAVNFSDGLDGLAAGLSAAAFVSLFIYGIKNGNVYPALSSLILASALIGFLPYNKYRAKTFMGDSGSQFLGLCIAIFSLGCAKENAYTVETTLFLIIPALDTALSVLRRIAKRKSPFAADKGHLHHFLLSKGISHPLAVRLLVFTSMATAFITLVLLEPH